MIVLQSKDGFDDLAILNTVTGQVSWISKKSYSLALSDTHGSVARMHGHTLCLYRTSGVLHFRVDDQDIQLTEDTSVSLVALDDDTYRITVSRTEAVLFDWTYKRPLIWPPLEWDPTFVREDDFDYCLFVWNVANDPGRRARIYS